MKLQTSKFRVQKAALALAAGLLAEPARAADLQGGHTFAAGDRPTASQVNALVNSATILPGFYSGKPAVTTLGVSDVVLVYRPSLTAFRQLTASDFLYQNRDLITNQTELTAPLSADSLLIYSTAAGALRRVTAATLALNNTNLIAGAPGVDTNTVLSGADTLLVLNGGTNLQLSVSNLLWNFTWQKPFTNLATHTAPTNQDRLLIWDATNGTNKTTTLAGLVTNLPALASATNGDTFAVFGSNGVLSRVTLGQMATTLSNAIVQPVLSGFTTAEITLAAGLLTNATHGLGSTPTSVRAVLVCKTAELGYAVGDELDARLVWNNQAMWSFGANATNVWLTLADNSPTFGSMNKTNGASGNLTYANWRAKLYATP